MKKILKFYKLCLMAGIIFLSLQQEISAANIFKQIPKFNSPEIHLFDASGNLQIFSRKASTSFSEGKFTWSGENKEIRSYLTLSVTENKVRGSVSGAGNDFQFKGNLEKQEIYPAPTKRRSCGGCRFTQSQWADPRPRSAAQTKHAWRDADAGQIDLMVVYPTAVKNAIGSFQETVNEINNAVAGANLCFRNSDVQVHLRLVHIHETDYIPTSNLDVDLERLTQKGDGYLDDVHNLRDQYGADIVTLLSTDSDMGGLANTLNYPSLSFEDSAFNVCVWDQIGAPVYTLAHEIGHNMGCLHNREDASDSSQSSDYDYGSFAYGKRWYANGNGYRTVMAYNDSVKSFDHSIPFFSNPSISYLGVPTGNVEQENNALALKLSAPYVSNFRESKIQGILPSMFSATVGEGNYTTLWVRLASEPINQIQVNLSLSSNENFLLGSSPNLSFDKDNWNLRQPVQVIGAKDEDLSDESGILTLSADGLSSVDVTLDLIDNHAIELASEFYFSGVTVNSYGYAVDGVKLSFSAGNFFTSDENGSFISLLDEGYSGIITPSKSGYSFSPQSISISNLSNHSLGNAFVATRSSVVYVNHQATGNNDGTSWNNAFTNLSTALSLVDSFTEVWVAEGTYLPGNVRSASFLLPSGVSVLGGFAGGEISSSERDFSQNETILSGDIGINNNHADNSFHVIVPMDDSLIDGFIIQEGNATENYSDDRGRGAGLWAENVAFEIRNCEFRNNWAFQGGGAVWLSESNVTFSNCIFSSNITGTTGSGGAIWADNSNVTIESSSIISNYASYWGGALRIDDGNFSLNNSTISANGSLVSNGGGAIYQNAGTFRVSNSSFTQNQSSHQGGAILIRDATGVISDSNFTGNQNTVSNGGGALYIENCSPVLLNCRFLQNTTDANNHGGAIKLVSSNADIEDCVFQDNHSLKNSGGAIFIDESSVPVLKNNQFYENSSQSWGGAIYCKNPDLNVSGGIFVGNWSEFGGGVATNGTSEVNFENLKILGNESNASSSARGGFLYLGSNAVNSNFVNCIIAGNKSAYRHGVFSPGGVTRFINCTIFGNQAVQDGGIALLFEGDSIFLENSIIWENSDGNNYEIFVNTGSASASYSILNEINSPRIILNEGTFSQEPNFKDPAGTDGVIGTNDDDFRLSSNSPAINAGTAELTNYNEFDLDGRRRDENPDLGALEFFLNQAPSFSMGSQSYIIAENSTYITDINATDMNGDDLTYSLVGGADQALFSIDHQTGALSFKSPPDYENPADADLNNVYQVELAVSDGTLSSTIVLEITVSDVTETVVPVNTAPEFSSLSSSIMIAENSIYIIDLNATDVNGDDLTYSLVGGVDQSLFSIDQQTGELSFPSAPDYENPADADLNNVYKVELAVSDGSLSSTIALEITVADVTETVVPVNTAPEFSLLSSSLMIAENSIYIVDLNATDVDGDELTYSLVGGVDQSLFSIDQLSGELSFKSAPDYEFPEDGSLDNVYLVDIKVSDGADAVEKVLSIMVLDIDESAQSPKDSKILINGYPLGNGWREASWFGTYYSESHPWVYHSSMGWVYVVQSKEGSSWMWQTKLGWIWTDIDIFPYFYINSIGEWGFAGDKSNTGQYYLFETGNERWTEF